MNMHSALTSTGGVMVVLWILSLLIRQILVEIEQKLSAQEVTLPQKAVQCK